MYLERPRNHYDDVYGLVVQHLKKPSGQVCLFVSLEDSSFRKIPHLLFPK